MKKLLGLLAGALILVGSAGVSSAQGFYFGHRGHHSSYGFGFGFPSYYYGGCYRPAPVYYAPSYYSYPSYSYPAYGYGYAYPGYSYSYTGYGW